MSIVPFLGGRARVFSANLDVVRQVVGGGVQESAWDKMPAVTSALR